MLPGLLFSIARSFGYTHLRHLWNIFQDRTTDVSLRIETQIKLHGTGDYMVFVFQFIFFLIRTFSLKPGGGEDAWFFPSLLALMISNTGEPVVTAT